MSQQKQLSIFLFEAATLNQFYYGIWAQPTDQRVNFTEPGFWKKQARLAERGLFDGIFLADIPEVKNTYRRSYDPTVAHGVFTPNLDPFQIATIIATETTHLGVVVTSPTTYGDPHQLVRRVSTLDHLSGGRAGWNIVFSNTPSSARLVGRDRPLTSDEYYARADEFIDVAYKLWEGSWDPEAVVADKTNRVFAAPDTVHPIEHRGDHFTVTGASTVHPSPQRLPFLAQASGSQRGVAFAAKNAELVLVGGPTRDIAAKFVQEVHKSAAAQGRSADSVKTTALVDVIVGHTREEAQAKARLYDSYITLDGALAWTESTLTYDDFPAHAVIGELIEAGHLPATGTAASFGVHRTIGEFREEFRFLRLAHRAIGTVSDVADEIESWMDDDGLDAINLRQYHVPDTLTDFVNLVVPELQRRGRFRTSYREGQTLRERVLGTQAWIGHDHPAHRYRYAFTPVATAHS